MDSESGSGSTGSGSGMVSEGALGQSNDDVVVGIVVGAVSLVALLSIAAVFFLLVRGNRIRHEELELQRCAPSGNRRYAVPARFGWYF